MYRKPLFKTRKYLQLIDNMQRVFLLLIYSIAWLNMSLYPFPYSLLIIIGAEISAINGNGFYLNLFTI